jgi:hypothetical protein
VAAAGRTASRALAAKPEAPDLIIREGAVPLPLSVRLRHARSRRRLDQVAIDAPIEEPAQRRSDAVRLDPGTAGRYAVEDVDHVAPGDALDRSPLPKWPNIMIEIALVLGPVAIRAPFVVLFDELGE